MQPPVGVVLLVCLLRAYLYKLHLFFSFLILCSWYLVQLRMSFLMLPVQKEAFPWTLFMVINLAFGLAKYIRMISLCAARM